MKETMLSPSQRNGEVNMQWGVKIPTRDGLHLSANLYLPRDHTTPRPVIFALTPYVAQSLHDEGVYFARHGFPFLAVDVRGRGDSEGDFEPFIYEGADGHDVVEWLARQTYCSGQVAMWGGSNSGFNQWTTAAQGPPHLAAIAPTASGNIGFDFPLRANVMLLYAMQWLIFVSGRATQDKIFGDREFWRQKYRQWFEEGLPLTEFDSFVGRPSAIFQEWIKHPAQGSYWDRYNPTPEEYAKVRIPVLTITGIFDADQPGALKHYQNHIENCASPTPAEHYLVIGPWDHAGTRRPSAEFCGLKCGPASLVDLRGLHLEWYSWTMSGGPKPSFLQKKVAYYVMGAERWRYADTLSGVTSCMYPLYLQSTINPIDVFSAGQLSAELSKDGGPDCYIYDPRDIRHAQLECLTDPSDRTDQCLIYSMSGRQLIYHSEPFVADTEVSGFFRLAVWISIDQPDTDFAASVYEIDAANESVRLTDDVIRARFRESPREERLVCTTDPLLYEFRGFTFVSRLIKKGCRLRLVIGPLNSIYRQKNCNSGKSVAEDSIGDARPVEVRLFRDAAHPSALFVPLATVGP